MLGVSPRAWHRQARCLTIAPRTFFEGIFDENGNVRTVPKPKPGESEKPRPIDFVRANTCGICPARRECAAGALADEAGKPIKSRHGLFGYLTPAQRHSVERRGGLACPQCGELLDPKGFVDGWVACDSCDYSEELPAIPDDGDGWLDRHTKLSVIVVAWLVDNTAVNDSVPSPTHLAGEIGARKHDVIRVYEALVVDCTLERVSQGCYRRLGRTTAMKTWRPPYVAAS